MFYTEAKGISWSRTGHGRGKRAEQTLIGCFVLEHISTGKIVVGTSRSVSRDVDGLLKELSDVKAASKSNKPFAKLCALDADIKIYEYTAKNLSEARRIEKEVRETVTPRYLLLN